MKNSFKNLGLLIFTLVISLLLGEVLVRIVAPQQLIVPSHHIWRPDETIGWRHVEDTNTQINTGEGTVHFVTDNNGYRINYPAEGEKSTEPDISIITIGDSFVEAVQVENRYTMQQVIQKMLSDKYGKRVNVINDGVGAWGPNQYLMEAKLALAKNKYDLGIIFLYTGNDIVVNKQNSFSPQDVSGQHHFRFPRSLKWSELRTTVFYPINDFLENSSHLFVLLKNRFQTIRARIGLTADYFPSVFKLNEKDSKRWQITAEICEEIEHVFSENGTPVFFVLLSAPYQVLEKDFYRHIEMFDIKDSVDIDQPNTVLRDRFKSKSLHLVDPLMHMRKLAEHGQVMHGHIDAHFNEYGHKVVAEYIMGVVEEYLLHKLEG